MTAKKNIMLISYGYPPRNTGPGMYVHYLGQALVNKGHRVVVVTARAEGYAADEQTGAGRVYRLYDREQIGSNKLAQDILKIADKYRIDWIEGADHLGECAALLTVKNRPPIVIKAHSSNPIKVLYQSEICYPWQKLTTTLARWKVRRQTAAERDSLLRADMLITPSARLLFELEKQFGRQLPANRNVIPNPVEIPAESDTRAECLRPTVLFVGRLAIGKGIEYLPKIIEEVLKAVPDAQFRIVGPDSYARGLGSLKRWLERKLGTSAAAVTFAGVLDSLNLDGEYRSAWVTIVPSKWDNFPTVALEAMSRACPLVTSGHGGMVEMLDGTDCSIEDPSSPCFSEAIIRILQDSSFREKAGRSAYNKAVSAYHPALIAEKYVETIVRGLA